MCIHFYIPTSYSICTIAHILLKNKFYLYLLKPPSLFAAWLFWTFHTNSHNMKALVIPSHSWSPFLPLICLYGKSELLWISTCGLLDYFLKKTILPRLHMQITWSWPPVGRYSHGLITVRQKKMWT